MSTPATAPARRSATERLLGVLGAAMVLAALVLLVRGGARDGDPAGGAPPIELVRPGSGEALAGNLEVVFRLDRELALTRAGWGVDTLHLHLLLDGTSIMPAAADIVRLQGGAYRWTLAPLDPGEHSLRLYWSDPQHRPIASGGSPAVRVHAR